MENQKSTFTVIYMKSNHQCDRARILGSLVFQALSESIVFTTMIPIDMDQVDDSWQLNVKLTWHYTVLFFFFFFTSTNASMSICFG